MIKTLNKLFLLCFFIEVLYIASPVFAAKVDPMLAHLEMTQEGSIRRDVSFNGNPITITTRVDMVTLIIFPTEPILLNAGRGEGFQTEIIPELNYLVLKPITADAKTNLIVTTKTGIYTFFIYATPRNEPGKKTTPFDMLVRITDPLLRHRLDSIEALVTMIYNGKKLPEFQLISDIMTTPNSSINCWDQLLGIGVQVTLLRVHFFPHQKQATWWLRFENVVPGGTTKVTDQTYGIDEKSVWTQGILKVAVPNIGNMTMPLMRKGDKLDMFIVTKTDSFPAMFNLRFAMQGSRTIPIEASFPTRQGGYSSKRTTNGKPVSPEYQKLLDDLKEHEGSPGQDGNPGAGPHVGNDYLIDDKGNVKKPSNEIIFDSPGGSIQRPSNNNPAIRRRTVDVER